MSEWGVFQASPIFPTEMTVEQKCVLRTLYNHEFGRIVRQLGQGGVGAAYLADLTNPLQILASRIAYGDESPQLFGLADILYDEHNPREITSHEQRKRIHDAAHKIYIENGPPHDKKPPAALETYMMLLEAINKTLPEHKHEDHFDVVVKILKRRTESDKDIENLLNEDARKRFIQEAKVLKKLDHKNIVKLFGMIDAQGIGTCLVMEYVGGESLDAYLQKQPDRRIPPEQAVDIMLSLIEPVEYMHSSGVIHRDIKPSNILLRPNLSPVIIDFGIVKDVDTNLTLVGTRMGTPAYMCPEFIRDGITEQNTTPLVDIYSLGTIFFEMLSGRRAYEGSQEEIFKKALERKHPTRLVEFAGSISDELVYLVEAARAKLPEKRLKMDEFREMLAELKEKKLYSRQSPRPSTTILLKRERAIVDARCKSNLIQQEEIHERLASSAVDECVTDIKSLTEVGLYEEAREKLDTFLKHNPVSDTELRKKLDEIAESINKDFAEKEARKHIDKTMKLIKDQDYVAAEKMLAEAERYITALPKNEHPDVHAAFQTLLHEYDTHYRMGATVVRSLQSAVESARSFLVEAGLLYCEGKPVDHKRLELIAKQVSDINTLAKKVRGVAEMPLYKQLDDEAAIIQASLQKLNAYCSARSQLENINDFCEGILASGVTPDKSQLNKLVEGFDSVKKCIAQIAPEMKGRFYETLSASIKKVHNKLESLINKE